MKTKLLFLFLTITIACDQTPAATQEKECEIEFSSQVVDYAQAFKDLYSYSLSSDIQQRPNYLQPNQILPKLHSHFASGLCKSKDGELDVYFIDSLPNGLAREISPESSTGFAILNNSFWEEVYRIQKLNLRVGFLVNPGKHQFAGYYNGYYKHIVFDILANPGTAKHELRHHEQYATLEEVKAKTSYFSVFDSERVQPNQVPSTCIYPAARFFGELDANTYQFSTWLGAFNIHQLEDKIDRTKANHFPHLELFLGFLNYPKLASQWLENKDCPDDLLGAINLIIQKTEAFHQFLGPKIAKFKHASTIHYNNLNALDRCKKDLDNSFLCKKVEEDISKYNRASVNFLREIYAAIEEESKRRPLYISDELKKLNKETDDSLLKNSGGYLLLKDLKGYN